MSTTTFRRLSRRVAELAPSQTLALTARAAELRRQGVPVISFAAGEPDFVSPDVVCEAAKAAIDAGQTHYSPVPGTLELREAIVARVQRDYGFQAEPSQALVSTGAKQVLFNVLQALVDPGDEVLIPSPYWVSYPAMVALAGGRAIPVETLAEENFRLNPETLQAAIGPRCKALILNNPSNPTGAVLSAEDVQAIVKLALDRKLIVVADEIYSGLVFDDVRHSSVLSVKDPRVPHDVVLVDGVSKSFAMTGWRIGYAVGPPDIIKAASKIQSQVTSGACTIAQAAAVAALSQGQPAAQTMRQAFAARRAIATARLEEIPGVQVPRAEGAFYLFPNMSAYLGTTLKGRPIDSTHTLSEVLLEYAHVAAVPGSAFGLEGHLRFSYALDEADIETGLTRVKEFLAQAVPHSER